jgi:dipeptide/tripeptide permease
MRRHGLTHVHQIFLFFPFYFVCWIQIWNNLISQAGEMALHGTPNDLLQNLDPIALIVFIPLLDRKFGTSSLFSHVLSPNQAF